LERKKVAHISPISPHISTISPYISYLERKKVAESIRTPQRDTSICRHALGQRLAAAFCTARVRIRVRVRVRVRVRDEVGPYP